MGLNNHLPNNTSMIKVRLNKLTLACYKKTVNANINLGFKNKTTLNSHTKTTTKNKNKHIQLKTNILH